MNCSNTSFKNPRALLLGLLTTLALAAPALALDLHEAKEQGLVGETASGYIEAVSPSAAVSALVKEINTQRAAEYRRIAENNNISIDAVELLAGKKAIEKTAAGQYIKVGGDWQKK